MNQIQPPVTIALAILACAFPTAVRADLSGNRFHRPARQFMGNRAFMTTLTARLLLFGVSLGFAQEAKSATLLYAMTENGRLYRSADGAKSWQNIVLPATSGQFYALAVDPENSLNLYVDVGPRGKAAPGQPDNVLLAIRRRRRNMVTKQGEWTPTTGRRGSGVIEHCLCGNRRSFPQHRFRRHL